MSEGFNVKSFLFNKSKNVEKILRVTSSDFKMLCKFYDNSEGLYSSPSAIEPECQKGSRGSVSTPTNTLDRLFQPT